MKGTERRSLCEQSIAIARMERQCSKRIANISRRALLCVKYFQMVHDLLRSWRSALRGFPMK